MDKVQSEWTRAGRTEPIPEKWHRKLKGLTFSKKTVCYRLLATKKFKSAARDALKTTLIRWLDGTAESRAGSPFSDEEWRMLGAESFR